ncbi:SpoIID/LytB domain-containing protein [Anaerosolibacter sp.]|uniref:SpoIID/LytB domain-containing protein n=1 Tax=Anaerosolibacter sp. TaxID=1872527 RepID=UPI0039F09740
MRNILKITAVLLLVSIIHISIPLRVYGYDKGSVPEYVKIGLKYGESATPMISISGKNGLALGSYINSVFNPIISFLSSEEIHVRKDSYFMGLNGSFIEYQYNEQMDNGNQTIQGPIHIQIGPQFSSQEEAQAFMSSLTTMPTKPYLSFEDGWKVWTGMFTSTISAQSAIEALRLTFPEHEVNIIPQNNRRIQVISKTGDVLCMVNLGETEYYFKSNASNMVKVDGKNFRGDIGIKRYTGSDLTIINRISLEEYLYGVVPKEMSGTWPLEAQKAQAVAARNYAIEKLGSHNQYGFDLCATTHCQVYGGFDSEHERSRGAVDETRGKFLTYNGELVTPFYHSNSGGHTENSENIWSSPIGYLKGVSDPFSIGAPNDTWTYVMTKDQIQEVLNSKQLSVGDLNSIQVTSYSDFGRVLKMEVSGSSDKKILEKEKVRSIFGYNNIKSTWFTVNTDASATVISGDASGPKQISSGNLFIAAADGARQLDGSLEQIVVFNGIELKNISFNANQYVFTGKGWGHGLGMSQWGAKKMAEEGYTYDQILTYYYTGTQIE